MGWENIGGLLGRFKNLKPPKKFMQDEVVEIIQRVIGASIDPDGVEHRGGMLYIKTKNPAVKNQIFMNKEKILAELSKKLGPRTPIDIRF